MQCINPSISLAESWVHIALPVLMQAVFVNLRILPELQHGHPKMTTTTIEHFNHLIHESPKIKIKTKQAYTHVSCVYVCVCVCVCVCVLACVRCVYVHACRV